MLPDDAMTLLRQQIRQRTEIVRAIAALREEIDCDRICGSWLSTENNLSAVIRRIGTMTYRLLVYDHSLCYKRLVQDAVISSERHTLLFATADDPRDVNRVEYDSGSDALRLGCYGRFVAEDSAHRQDAGVVKEEYPIDE